MNRQRVATPAVINPADIERDTVKAIMALNVSVRSLFDQVQRLEKIVSDHDEVINGSESAVNT